MSTKKPMHNQIADILRQRIGAGKYEKNGLPPELVMMEEFGVSRHTIRSALQRLVIDGLIERVAGRGTTVSKRPVGGSWLIGSLDELLEYSVDRIKSVDASLVPARNHPHVAALFGVPLRGRVFRLVRILRSTSDLTCSVANIFTSPALASRLPPEDIPRKLFISLIERHCGVRTEQVRQVTSAGVADENVAKQLEMKPGDPVLLLHRTYTSTDGEPIMYVELTCRPDRYQHTVTFVHEKTNRSAVVDEAMDAPADVAPEPARATRVKRSRAAVARQ